MSRQRQNWGRKVLAAGVSVGLAASALVGAGNAATTTDPGSPVRDAEVTIKIEPGGRALFKSSATSTTETPISASSARSLQCVGLGADADPDQTMNRSPRSRIVIKDPDGNVIHTARSPLVGTIPTSGATAGQGYYGGAWSIDFDLEGRPAGDYTVETYTQDAVKVGLSTTNPATVCTLKPEVMETLTFEYRPWEYSFQDRFGGGSVSFNTSPEELQWKIGNLTSPVIASRNAIDFYGLPGDATVLLPGDPVACGTDPASCLPAGSVLCDDVPGCVPEVAIIHWNQGKYRANGLVDLTTGAMAVLAKINATSRLLISGGDDADGLSNELLDQLADLAAANGVDVRRVLAKRMVFTVRNANGGKTQVSMSVLEGLQIAQGAVEGDPTLPLAPLSVGAGSMVHVGVFVDDCSAGYGYTVQTSDLLPELPTAPSLLALLVPGGKVTHVRGVFPAPGGPLGANTSGHTNVINASVGDPNGAGGLPIHLPLLQAGVSTADRGFEFVGTAAAIITSNTPLFAGLCLGINSVVLGSPLWLFGAQSLPIGLGDLPGLWDDQTQTIDDLNLALSEELAAIVGNPEVQELLDLVLSNLPELPGVPGVPEVPVP